LARAAQWLPIEAIQSLCDYYDLRFVCADRLRYAYPCQRHYAKSLRRAAGVRDAGAKADLAGAMTTINAFLMQSYHMIAAIPPIHVGASSKAQSKFVRASVDAAAKADQDGAIKEGIAWPESA
jgi:hypothetical protein